MSYGFILEVGAVLKNLELLEAVASSNSYAFLLLSQPPVCSHYSMEHTKS